MYISDLQDSYSNLTKNRYQKPLVSPAIGAHMYYIMNNKEPDSVDYCSHHLFQKLCQN